MKLTSLINFPLVMLVLLAGAACADESTIRAEIAKKIPKATVESITKTSHLGLYEIVIDGQVIYSDADFKYILNGELIETKGMTNLTVARQQELEDAKLKKLAFPFEQLPFDLAFKKVKGDGSRKIAVFSDPDCPYCKRLEQSFTKLDNVTIFMFLFPLEQLHPKAPAVSRSIWCSPDRVKAWDDYMLKGVAPSAAGSCDNPVDKIVAFGQSKRISGTPTLFFTDGRRVPGAIPLEQIESLLAKAHAAK
jgi:thiol:disulfide interchange protein DsbC